MVEDLESEREDRVLRTSTLRRRHRTNAVEHQAAQEMLAELVFAECTVLLLTLKEAISLRNRDPGG